MNVSVENELLNRIRDEAHQAKIAHQPYTCAQLLERIIWRHVFQFGFFHGAYVASLLFLFWFHLEELKWQTVPFGLLYGYLGGLGVTAGVHRLWTHRSYNANLGLRIVLMLLYSSAGMNTIFDWVRDHRVHHKFSETDADPHNAQRGFFFSHCGWLLMKRHPEYIRQARTIDMTDISADPVVRFNKKYATPLTLLLCFALPTAIPVIFWEEKLLHAVLGHCIVRYLSVLHLIWTVNSVAHLWGDRPYNRFINPAENIFVSFWTMGEGSHNYHHTFPWDYKTSEFSRFNFNFTRVFIDSMAKLGWAYGLRQPSPEFIEKVTRRLGQNSG